MNKSGALDVNALEMTQLRFLPTWLVLPALLLSLLAAPVHTQTRQSAPDDALFRTMVSLDSGLFDAFNTCNLEKFGRFSSRKWSSTRALPGGRRWSTASRTTSAARPGGIIPGTLEVHPMDG